jgi:hypothetical protein
MSFRVFTSLHEGAIGRREPPYLPPAACGGANREKDRSTHPMHITPGMIQPLIALVAGVLVLIQPKLLNYIVAIYLIVVGVLGLAPYF